LGHTSHAGSKIIEGEYIGHAAATVIFAATQWIKGIVVSNKDGTVNPHFTILDGQGTPLPFVFGVNTPVPVGSAVEWNCPDDEGWPCTGGMTAQADTANSLVIRVKYFG